MIITKLIGGLGNQMFQYAVGRHLAYKNKTKLKLDISGFKSYKLRRYELGCFNIVEDFANDIDIKIFNLKRGLERRFNILKKLNKNILYTEKVKFKFDPEVLKCKGNIYLNGSWQSEKYFKDIETDIRREFTVKIPQIGKNKKIARQISSCKSPVSLHMRRGDYVFNPHTNQILGTCTLDYYYRCVKYLARRVMNPHFFVFGDDPKWARNNLKLSYPTTFIDHNCPDKGYEDLRLMSQCKHHIIANSSFSWWGAWLAKNKNKIILVPKKWLNINLKTPDLLPNNWIKI